MVPATETGQTSILGTEIIYGKVDEATLKQLY